jgi:hypothetical protein
MLDQKNQETVQYNQSGNRRPIDQLRRAGGGAAIAGQRARICRKCPKSKKPADVAKTSAG